MKYQPFIGLTLALLAITTTVADDLSGPQVTEIIRSLSPNAEGPVVAGAPLAVTKRVVLKDIVIIIDPAHSLDFEVYFPFGSAEITPQARMELVSLGKALASKELRDHRYLIAGHTDAKGSAAYNLDLSSRRAVAVRQILLENSAIDPLRLITVGFGETELKVSDAPNAGINRRVEVVLVLSQHN